MFDGGIVGIYLLATMTVGLMVRKYVGKVEHFIVAGREVNVYLGIASLAATEFGIVTCMYTAQNGYKYGFAGATPGIIYALAMGIVGLTGFCIKPMREAGVMTIPELFEKQFGPRIRWLAGVVIVLGGLLNMGVFLRMGGEFLVNVAGLNTGYLEITMTGLLLLVAVYTILGGMLSVLVTDFLQFVVMSAGLLVVTVLILSQVGWQTITDTVQTHCGSGGFNPFIHNDLGWPYIVFNLLTCTAAVLTWQTMVQRLLASRDSRTARKVYTRTGFFFVCRFLLPGIWGIAALAVLGPQQNDLLAMPKYLSTHVPIGLMGILIAAMLAADMSTNSSYMLSWGSVIYNDILRPIHRGLWTDRRGLLCNRLIVAAIGIFLLLFGLWYPLEEDLWVYLNLTGAIYFSSISMLLIACCYWKRANNWGAAGAIIFGAAIPIAFLVLQQVPATKHYADRIGPYYSGIAAFGIAALAMMVGSLIKPRSRTGVMER
ncbi:MAG: sodium:solute symporter family protein [Phycisphaerales bacterium]|nr:sodium:solute symporter family protein [Phycisphaerales bacterium]